jgi:hypothetical protein
MKLNIFFLLLMTVNYCQAQMARAIVDDACKDGANLFSKIARTNVIETYKIASETDANSPDRVRRIQLLESEREEVIGQLKKMNRDSQEEWVKKGISRDIASLRRKTLDSTIYISMSLAYKNPNWDLNRLILETQEQCEK